MEFIELTRVLIAEEIADMMTYRSEAEVLGSDPRLGADISRLFPDIADAKRNRLEMLNRISGRSVSCRQGKKDTVRSIEASLRTHAARAERNVRLYRQLIEELNKQEYKETVTVIIAEELSFLEALRALQARIKQQQ